MTITIDPKKTTVRETTAKYRQADDNEADIRVLFYSFTTKRLKEIRSSLKARIDAGETLWHSETLVDQLHGLPDLVDADGQPHFVPHEGNEDKRAAALEFLDALDADNIEKIKTAIDDAISPKDQPEK